jgi:hypothetical protein
MGETTQEEYKYDPRHDEESHRLARKKLLPARGQTLLTKDQLLDVQRIERERTEARRMRRCALCAIPRICLMLAAEWVCGRTRAWASDTRCV